MSALKQDVFSLQSDLENSYLVFEVNDQAFAFSLKKIREVIQYQGAQPVSRARKYFDGLVNVRGEVLGVIDLRVRLGLEPTESSRKVMIVIALESFSFGVVVDRLISVDHIHEEQIQPSSHHDSFLEARYMNGVFMKGEHFVTLMDIASLIKDSSIIR